MLGRNFPEIVEPTDQRKEHMRYFASAVADVLERKHRRLAERARKRIDVNAKWGVSDDKGFKGFVTVYLADRRNGRMLAYELHITAAGAFYGTVEGTIIKTHDLLIVPSMFRLRRLVPRDVKSNNIRNDVEDKIWPVVKYWQEIVQLDWTQVPAFKLLYAKGSKLARALLG